KTRNDILPFHIDVKSEYIMRASKLVTNITGLQVQANKAIVGANAFAHESGIHQDGVLKHAETYEIMKPESIGLTRNKLVMGKHSGRAAFKDKLKELNLIIDETRLDEYFEKFKDLADKKKDVFDEDIVALVGEETRHGEKSKDGIKFVSLDVSCGSKGQKASVTLKINGSEKTAESNGQGPIDAIFKAIKKLIDVDARLVLYDVTAVTEGIDSQAEVLVRLRDNKSAALFNGSASDIDTTIASAKAYIDAVNKLTNHEEKIDLLDS
ncbi:MAG: alpha-isopropylmalate synthase regulatory domain-containing protein, partial [Rickettsiales bacterium]|nr:alpha-isopropylmalate synthase regulatory domain-containing protein [Rickettsiales bacterium]